MSDARTPSLIKDFFLFRPVFTPGVLKIIWWLVLVAWILISVIPTLLGIQEAYRASLPLLVTASYLTADFVLKFFCLILVRLVLEIALLLSSRSSQS